MAEEFFVIRTREGQYVGPLGFTPEIGKAVFFTSRWAALGKCSEMGNVLDGAAIIPYSPATPPEGSQTATGAKKASRRARTPWKASNGDL
jgi:hypothetical protein